MQPRHTAASVVRAIVAHLKAHGTPRHAAAVSLVHGIRRGLFYREAAAVLRTACEKLSPALRQRVLGRS